MSNYCCPACNQQFSQVEVALNHVNSHSIGQRGCVVPGCCRTNPYHLYKHSSRSHPSSCNYHCSACPRAFVRQCHLSQHSRDKHAIIPATTPVMSYLSPIRYARAENSLFQVTSQFSTLNVHRLLGTGVHYEQNACNEEFDLNSPTTAVALNRFIASRLQPTEKFNDMMYKTVGKICSFFRGQMSPKEIVKGGSLGKGTAVRGKADIDLVLILNDINTAAQLEKSLPSIQKKIEQYLKSANDLGFNVIRQTITKTRFLVQFTVKVESEEIKVDLLPSFYFADKQNVYRQMTESPDWLLPFYSASLVKMQVDFVSAIPANVKNLIRLVKYWRKEYVGRPSTGRRLPTSYVLELIVIHLWESKGGPYRFDTVKAFHSVMEALVDVESLHVIWRNNYTENMIPAHISHQRPLVMDPANPFNNVCKTFEWEEVREEAKRALDSAMLSGITSLTWQ